MQIYLFQKLRARLTSNFILTDAAREESQYYLACLSRHITPPFSISNESHLSFALHTDDKKQQGKTSKILNYI